MKDKMLKIAGVKSEKEFYKKYPTEEAFMKKHGKAFKKAAMGTKMVQDQLIQLTDFGNPPLAQDGFNLGLPSLGASFDPKTGLVNSPTGSVSKMQTSALGFGDKAPGADAGGMDGLGLATAAINAIPAIVGGIDAIGKQKQNIKQADVKRRVAGAAAQAAESRDVDIAKHNFVRPEDSMIQAINPFGQAKFGTHIGGNLTEIQNTYAPGNIYEDLGYEPLNNSDVKQFKKGGKVPEAEFGDYFQSSGQAQIGGAAGQAIGSAFFGPLGGAAGKILGTVAGNLLGGAEDANKLARFNSDAEKATSRMGVQQGIRGMQTTNSAFMKRGGWVSHDWQPQTITKFGNVDVSQLHSIATKGMDTLRTGGSISHNQMFTQDSLLEQGGEVATHWGGEANLASENPHLPGTGETLRFDGQSHDTSDGNGNTGIGTSVNGKMVEVQGKEYGFKDAMGNFHVLGGMDINKKVAAEIGDPKAAGRKFQTYAGELTKLENKQNKIQVKASELANNSAENDPFSQLSLASARANMIGANMKLKDIADKKMAAVAVQTAYLDEAHERGLVPNELIKGNIKKDKKSNMAKFGAKLETAQDGKRLFFINGTQVDPTDPRYAQEVKDFDAQMDAKFPGRAAQRIAEGIPAVSAAAPKFDYQPINQPSFVDLKKHVPFKPEPSVDVADPQPKQPSYFQSKKTGKALADSIVANALGSNYIAPNTAFQTPYESGITPIQSSPTAAAKLDATDLPTYDDSVVTEKDKTWENLGMAALSQISPFLRPTNQFPLEPGELAGEYMALATNQEEPVNVQAYRPMLKTAPGKMTAQEQLNEVDAQTRAATRMLGSNPAAAAQIFAQATEAKNKIRGEVFRANQAMEAGIANENIATLNDAQLKNIAQYADQADKQARAKSATKAQRMAALQSIGEKIAKNKQENLIAAIEQQRYNYRFTNKGVGYSVNDPYNFNVPNVGTGATAASQIASKTGNYNFAPGYGGEYDAQGRLTGVKKTKARNGAIVKALKTL